MRATKILGCALITAILFGPRAIAQRGRQPEGLYIVAEAVSDASPFWFTYVLDLSPSPDGLNLRWIRVAPFGNGCPGVTVKAMTGVIREPIPGIVEPNLCSISTTTAEKALARAGRRNSVWDTVGFGLVARCAGSTKVFHLPLADLVDMDRLKRESGDVAAMYDTYSRIVYSAFPNKSFYNISSQQDLDLQKQGTEFIPELRSGRFDAGLSNSSMASILRDYRGIHPDGQELRSVVEVVSPSRDTIMQYVEPVYPPLAKAARIQGEVELDLDVDESGRVSSIPSVRGHVLLQDSARQAAVKWQFPTSLDATRSMRVVLKYVLVGGCE